MTVPCSPSPPSEEVVRELEGRLGLAKEELSAASMKLSILVKTFRHSQLYLTPTRSASIAGEQGVGLGGGGGGQRTL